MAPDGQARTRSRYERRGPSLTRVDTDAQVREQLRMVGVADLGDTLTAAVAARSGYLERCSGEAEGVLRGDLEAAGRLWLLLKDPVEPGPRLGAAHRDPAQRRRAPRVIDGDALLRLVAGVVRAANTPGEAEVMLRTLGTLLGPLLLLERAAAAADSAERGDVGPVRSLATLVWAPYDRAVMDLAVAGPGAPGPIVMDRTVTRPVPMDDIHIDRPVFDRTSWLDTVVSGALGEWDLNWRCVGGVHARMSEVDRFGERYTIDSISNPTACVGQTITLRGHGFGPSGRVSFSAPEADDPAFLLGVSDDAILVGAEPTLWTDTRVDVVVPPWASTGPVHLNAYTRVSDPCATIDVYRLGNSALFLGGLAAVLEVSLAGVPVALEKFAPRPNLAPGTAVTVGYRATGGPGVSVRVELQDPVGTVMWSRSGLPGGYGQVVMDVPQPASQVPGTAVLVLTATSACGSLRPLRVPVSLAVPPVLTITYVEVTQGVQGTLEEVLAGQGMPTVAHKDTAVRVHMRCSRSGWYDDRLDRITGTLRVDGGAPLAPTNVRNVVPDKRFAGVRGVSHPEDTNSTLNFTIPAGWLGPGPHSLAVHLVADELSGRVTADTAFPWTWIATRPFPVRVITMGVYPSDALMLDYGRRVLDLLPTSPADLGVAGPRAHKQTHDLRTKEGRGALLDELEDLWDDWDEHSGVRWLGMVSHWELEGGGWLGVSGTPSIAVLASGDRPDAGAHELGHSVGLNHVDLMNPGDERPDGPYDMVDGGGLHRRPAFDVRTSTALPLPVGDLMSYFMPVRAGITTWMRLLAKF